ncbi:TonB-dependent receptor [Uruburuella testudinis]|uniref:TonB-dependent receptor n=1 Tax=Uruburuella testudinis TaxID=1282863 RepID=A0ABY4DNY7_9NEIS|nr:TonB-dependent receptor [Uruburuella testudinis]UOO80764.1 TonB-dependent receptor [Uruburuella testudinis]
MRRLKHNKIALNVAAALMLLPVAVYAQDAAETALLPEVEVLGTRAVSSAKAKFMGTKTVLEGVQLQQNRAPTLGGVVEKTAGVQSEHFGPNSGRPVVRSLSGSRVQVLANDLSLQDVAVISGNLPAQIEPFMAEKIEIIKGPASVLYGGSAIGGSVNVDDGRVPVKIGDKRFSGKIDVSGGMNTPNTQMFRLDGNNGSNWAWHIDGLRRQISSYRIPGRTKADVCYDPSLAGSQTALRDMCQMNMKLTRGGINPAWYPYLNKYFIDNPDELESEIDRYHTRPANHWGVPNPPNPAYVPGSPPNLPDIKGPLTDMVAVPHGRIPNSHLKTQSFSAGTSYISEKGYVGIAVNRYQTDYGVPGFAYDGGWSNGVVKNIGWKPANIRARQTRWDVRAALNEPLPGIERIGLSLGYAKAENGDYLGEFLSSGLNSTSKQMRVEVSHAPLGPFSGTFGMAANRRIIDSSGEDAYMPSVKSREQGFFVLEKANFDPVSIEMGARWDSIKHDRKPDDYRAGQGWGKYHDKPHRFALQNYHAALQWHISDTWNVKLQRSWSERAPEVNELYASNRHLATLSVEEGNAGQQKEKAIGWELSSSMERQNWQAQATLYRNEFRNYSYLGYTGLSSSLPGAERLLVRQWRQHDTTLSGMELSMRYRFLNNRSGQWFVGAFGDWVKNRPKYHENSPTQSLAGNYMPGMPTSRYGGELAWERSGWRAAVGAVHYTRQKKVGKVIDNEPELPGYTLVDAHLAYAHSSRYGDWEWYLDGKNLTNREARPFNSPLKYLSPLPGRSLTAGVRVGF